MKCELCDRGNLSAKELAIHRKYFHTREDVTRQPGEAYADVVTADACPECGGQLFMQEGCVHCKSCGYSKCG